MTEHSPQSLVDEGVWICRTCALSRPGVHFDSKQCPNCTSCSWVYINRFSMEGMTNRKFDWVTELMTMSTIVTPLFYRAANAASIIDEAVVARLAREAAEVDPDEEPAPSVYSTSRSRNPEDALIDQLMIDRAWHEQMKRGLTH